MKFGLYCGFFACERNARAHLSYKHWNSTEASILKMRRSKAQHGPKTAKRQQVFAIRKQINKRRQLQLGRQNSNNNNNNSTSGSNTALSVSVSVSTHTHERDTCNTRATAAATIATCPRESKSAAYYSLSRCICQTRSPSLALSRTPLRNAIERALLGSTKAAQVCEA